jgi:hypothetical protein
LRRLFQALGHKSDDLAEQGKRMKKLLLLLAPILLSSCATGPQMIYADSAHPLSDTAVFSAQPAGDIAQIMSVDGKRPECWKEGCPVVVRVLPGTHTFLIQFQRWHGLLQVSGDVTVHVENMQPRHVYTVDYYVTRDEKKLRACVVDRGTDSNYEFCKAKIAPGPSCQPVAF